MIKTKDLFYIAVIIALFFYFKSKIKALPASKAAGSTKEQMPLESILPWNWLPTELPKDQQILDYVQPIPTATGGTTTGDTPSKPTTESAPKPVFSTASSQSKFTDDVNFEWPHRKKRIFRQ